MKVNGIPRSDIEEGIWDGDVIEFQKNVYCFKKACVLDDKEKVKEARKNLCTVKALSFYKYYMPRLRSRKWVKYHFPVLRKIF